MAIGIDATNATKLKSTEFHPAICESCAIGKHTRNLVRIPRKRVFRISEIIHTEIAGGGKLLQTLGGARCVLTLIGDYFNFVTIFLLKRKSEAEKALKDYISFMKNKGTPVQILRSDNGREFSFNHTQDLLKDIDIEWNPTAPHNPNQNGNAERNFRTLFERVKAILHHEKMPRGFWRKAIDYVCYLKNRSPTKRLKNKTLYEIWTGERPDVSNVRIFECTAYHYNVNPAKKKLNNRFIKCKFLGINGQNQFRLWDPSARRVMILVNILWDESEAVWSKKDLKDEDQKLEIFLNSDTDDEKVDTNTAMVSILGEETSEPITAAEMTSDSEEASNLTESELAEDLKFQQNDFQSGPEWRRCIRPPLTSSRSISTQQLS